MLCLKFRYNIASFSDYFTVVWIEIKKISGAPATSFDVD